jgi:hypothetical protein
VASVAHAPFGLHQPHPVTSQQAPPLFQPEHPMQAKEEYDAYSVGRSNARLGKKLWVAMLDSGGLKGVGRMIKCTSQWGLRLSTSSAPFPTGASDASEGGVRCIQRWTEYSCTRKSTESNVWRLWRMHSTPAGNVNSLLLNSNKIQ